MKFTQYASIMVNDSDMACADKASILIYFNDEIEKDIVEKELETMKLNVEKTDGVPTHVIVDVCKDLGIKVSYNVMDYYYNKLYNVIITGWDQAKKFIEKVESASK